MMVETNEHEKARTRTCAGCGKRDAADSLVRLVLDPASGDVAVDLAGSAYGRGAHVHPTITCVAKAASRGLSRAYKREVTADAAVIGRAIADAADRRAIGILGGAWRGKLVAIGADAVVGAVRDGTAALVVVARDAAAAADLAEVRRAVDEGKAAALGSKKSLGALFKKDEVAVCAVLDARAAKAVANAEAAARPFRSEAWSSSEVR